MEYYRSEAFNLLEAKDCNMIILVRDPHPKIKSNFQFTYLFKTHLIYINLICMIYFKSILM